MLTHRPNTLYTKRQVKEMQLPKNYLQLPAELSGSSSKNRFRLELLWGLYRIFDLYNQVDDFIAIFDYVCDVEIFTDSHDSYYQIKSKKRTKTYSVSELCKQEKGSSGGLLHSIMGKLYIIKNASDSSRNIKLAVVANVGLSHGRKEYTEKLEIPFSELDDDAKELVRSSVTKECGSFEDSDLRKIYFIRTTMDLANPQDTLTGKIVSWFVENKGIEVKNPHALYKTLFATVEEKASYEWKGDNIDDVISKKGITKEQFDGIIALHVQASADGVKLSQQWIKDNVHAHIERINLLKDLSTINQSLRIDRRLMPIEQDIEYVLEHDGIPADFSTQQLIDYLYQKVDKSYPDDYSEQQIRMLILLTVMKQEELACQI